MKITKQKKPLTGVVLILILSLSACNGNGIPKVEHNDDPLWNVELEGANPEFIEDYIYMWDVIENEYPMLSTAERLTGKDAESIKECYYNRINFYDDQQDFYKYVISPCLNEFKGAGHLCAVNDYFYECMYSLFLQNSEILDAPCEYDLKQMTRPQSKKFYSNAIENVEEDIAENGKNETYNTSENLRFEYFPEQSAAYVEIISMNTYDSLDNPEYKALKEFFTEIEKEGYKNCIIDIRLNGGGNDNYWTEGIVKPNLTETLSTTNYALIKGGMCQNYMSSVIDTHPIDELPTEKLPKLNIDDLNNASHYCDVGFECTPRGDATFSGKFWLLTSKRVYSASESFAVFCKETGFATLVGTVTGGDGIGITPMTISLPNTGICFRFSPELGLNADGSGNEEFGTTPDYEIAENENALEKCLELIAEGK